MYGHTIPVKLELGENKIVKILYHGTTSDATSKILKVGLEPMKRKWVHLSPTIEIAIHVGLRRDKSPVILEIDAEAARNKGARFYKATNTVYLCSYIRPEYIKRVLQLSRCYTRLLHASFNLEMKPSSSSAILFFTSLQAAGQFLYSTPTML